MTRIALFPGSFDPVTIGHEEIIRRGIALFDQVVVALGTNSAKRYLFTEDERMEMLKLVTLTLGSEIVKASILSSFFYPAFKVRKFYKYLLIYFLFFNLLLKLDKLYFFILYVLVMLLL